MFVGLKKAKNKTKQNKQKLLTSDLTFGMNTAPLNEILWLFNPTVHPQPLLYMDIFTLYTTSHFLLCNHKIYYRC